MNVVVLCVFELLCINIFFFREKNVLNSNIQTLSEKFHNLETALGMYKLIVPLCSYKCSTQCLLFTFLSYPPVDDRASPWNTAMNTACVSHIMWQLYHIGHVTSINFHCFQGRPYHLAPLTSLWCHDFSSDTHGTTNWRSILRNLFVHYLMNLSFMASLVSFCGLFF